MHTVDITPCCLSMRDLTPKKISSLLCERAGEYPENDRLDSGRVEFVIGQLVIRCEPTSTAILAVAKKFDKATGFNERRKGKTKISRSFSASTYKDFCEAGELENAYTYATNMDRSVFFECTHNRLLVNAKPIPGFSDFVSAIYFYPGGKKRDWDIYHTLSGLACSSLAHSRIAAVNTFKKIRADKALKLSAELPAHKLNFLSRMHEEYTGV